MLRGKRKLCGVKNTKNKNKADKPEAKRDFEQLKRRRRKGARLLEAGEQPAQIARRLGVSRQTVSRWQKQLRAAGRQQLVQGAGRAGRKPKLDAGQLARVEGELTGGAQAHGFKTQLWTLARVAQVIRQTTGVKLHRGHVWRVLRALGWSVQRPQTKARERDEQAIRRWVRVKWPAIKKSETATPMDRVHGRERGQPEAAAGEHLGEERLHASAGMSLQLEKTLCGQRACVSLGQQGARVVF
jgi:transposase